MRPIALALAALLVAGCGGDDAEEIPPTTRPAPRGPAADTTIGDTVAGADTAVPDTAASPGQEARAPGGDQRQGEAARPAQPSAPATAADGERLYTIQVAAFTDAASAEEWLERLRRQGFPVWTSMAEPGGRTFYRVRIGAVPTVREARQLGAMISERYDWPVWVAPMTAADRPPQDAVQATQRLLGGG